MSKGSPPRQLITSRLVQRARGPISSLLAAWVAIMEAMGDADRYKSAHANRGTRARRRQSVPAIPGRLRKAKRLEPAILLREDTHLHMHSAARRGAALRRALGARA